MTQEERISAKEFWKLHFGEYPQNDKEKLAVSMMQEYAGCFLPELQQLREALNKMQIEYSELVVESSERIEQQKETIEEFKAKLEHYRNETSKVQKFVYDRKDIGLPCQPIFDAIKDFIDEQAAEIESLK